MRNVLIILSMTTSGALLTGCTFEQAGGEEVGTADSAVTSTNGLSTNGLSTNGLSTNGLSTNGLSTNGLSTNGLSTNGLAALQDPSPTGTAYRQLLQYTVSCAFDPSQSFNFTWTDASNVVHNESYQGALGLAPGWANGPLNDSGQRIVSACLGARTNYFGVSVLVSLRSSYDSIEDQTPDSELRAYPYVEGTFWGNLFAATPYLNACYKTADVAHSRAALRDCASGYPNADGSVTPCGMIAIQGSCSNVCGPFEEEDGYYLHCVDHPGSGNNSRTKLVITTALP
jgi:hypothetical protein